MNTNKEIYTRLAEMIDMCSENVTVCVPSRAYYRSADAWSTENITIIHASQLISMLNEEAAKED